MKTKRKPAQSFSVGEYIADELEARGWTEEDLASRMPGMYDLNLFCIQCRIALIGQPNERMIEFMRNEAEAYAAAFGTSVELWINLDLAFRGVR